MSSIDRKFKNAQLRKEYEILTKEWADAKRNGKKINGKELGTKPGFGEFKRRLKAHEQLQKANAVLEQQKKVEEEKKIDLEWKDD